MTSNAPHGQWEPFLVEGDALSAESRSHRPKAWWRPECNNGLTETLQLTSLFTLGSSVAYGKESHSGFDTTSTYGADAVSNGSPYAMGNSRWQDPASGIQFDEVRRVVAKKDDLVWLAYAVGAR